MKTMEVYERVIKGKRLAPNSVKWYLSSFKKLSVYSEEFPSEGWQINEWVASIEGWNDVTILKSWKLVKAGANYVERISGKNPDGSFRFKNPFRDLYREDTPRVEPRKRRYFTPEELYKIVKACQTNFERCLILTLIDSTARISEITWLKYEDIQDGYFKTKRGFGMSKTGERRYSIDKMLCRQLRALAGKQGEYVFKRKNGQPFTLADDLSHRCRKIFIRAGFTGDKLGAHTLRHSSGTLIAKVTGSDLAVKSKLQHDKQETSHLYMHDVEDMIADKVSPLGMLGSLFGQDAQEVNPEQMMLGDGSKSQVEGTDIEVDYEVLDGETGLVVDQDLVSDMFIGVPDAVSDRPVPVHREPSVLSEDDKASMESFVEKTGGDGAKPDGDKAVKGKKVKSDSVEVQELEPEDLPF